MDNLAQRIQKLREERGLSRPALAAALQFPRLSIEKFEAGRQTPTIAQQERLAEYFGVSLFYLRGETTDRTRQSDFMDDNDWMDGAFQEEPVPAPVPRVSKPKKIQPDSGDNPVFDAFLSSQKMQSAIRGAVLDVLRSSEGQKLLIKAIQNVRK